MKRLDFYQSTEPIQKLYSTTEGREDNLSSAVVFQEEVMNRLSWKLFELAHLAGEKSNVQQQIP